MKFLPRELIDQHVAAALREDLGPGDATTLATIPESTQAVAKMIAREPLVLAGLGLACATFRQLAPEIVLHHHVEDGARVAANTCVLTIEGPARAILSAERVALNFVQRLSGVATLTAAYVDAISGTKARILDTRKTTPGWRVFEKYAVAVGGGKNHRMGLYDMILIKDNHLVALRNTPSDPIVIAVQRARKEYPALKVEVEADTLAQVQSAVQAGADYVLLDNMTPATICEALEIIDGKALTEASGGVSLATVRAVAETGVDFISVGALTHSARAMNLALDFEEFRLQP
jgi:nicotinate-nucleotide pyrophosphorylase (carboxylating)